MIPIEQKAPPGDRTAAEWNHVAYATRRRRRIAEEKLILEKRLKISKVGKTIDCEKNI
jgi:hypothetical protein